MRAAPSAKPRGWYTIVLVLALCAMASAIAWQRSLATWDDSYIYARTVRNVLEGRGWSFNADRPIDLCTSPLYFGLLLGASAVAGVQRIPDAATALYGLTLASTATLAFLGLRRRAGTAFAFLAAFGILNHQYVESLNGIETLLLLTCCLAAAWTYASGRHVQAALLLALAVLARPDALLLAAVLAVHYIAVHRRLPGAAMTAAFALPIAAWAAVHYVQFGSVLGSTLGAKVAQGETGLWVPFERGLDLSFSEGRPASVVQAYEWAKVLVAGGAVVALARRDIAVIALALYGVMHFKAYEWLGVPYYHWYYGAEYLAAWTLIALCFSAPQLLAMFLGHPRASRILAVAGAALMLLFVVRATDLGNRNPYRFAPGSLSQGYFELADRIRPLLGKGDRLLVVEIGTLGWALPEQTIEDTVGLTGYVTAGELGKKQFNAWLARADVNGPDYALVLDRFIPMILDGPIANGARFDVLYEPALHLEPSAGDRDGAFRATLYRRRSEPAIPDGRVVSLLPAIESNQLKPPEVVVTYVADRGRIHPMLFEHPVNQVRVEATVDRRYLLFGHGLLPAARPQSDGVRFMIRVEAGGATQQVYDVSMQPREKPEDQAFRHAAVDLERWIGQRVWITFQTEAIGTLDYDWSGWLSPRLSESPDG